MHRGRKESLWRQSRAVFLMMVFDGSVFSPERTRRKREGRFRTEQNRTEIVGNSSRRLSHSNFDLVPLFNDAYFYPFPVFNFFSFVISLRVPIFSLHWQDFRQWFTSRPPLKWELRSFNFLTIARSPSSFWLVLTTEHATFMSQGLGLIESSS